MASVKKVRTEKIALAAALLYGLGWLGVALSPPTRGRDWRGYSGVVRLSPAVVYRFTLQAPFATNPALDMAQPANQARVRETLEASGARNVTLSVGHQGVLVEFERSFAEPRVLDFSEAAFASFRPVLVRRLDGLDWDSP